MSVSKQQTKSIFILMLLTLGLVASLVTIAIVWKKDVIEVDLLQRTRQMLDQLGLTSVQVQFDGRDGLLSIPAVHQTQVNQHLDDLTKIEGVRQLQSQVATELSSLPQPIPSLEQQSESGLYIPPHDHPLEQIDLSLLRFHYAQTTLTKESAALLNHLVAELQRYPEVKIEIAAHTDNTGTALGNLAISSTRAQEVMQYLIQHGIEANRLSAVGYGSTRPIATNTTRQGRTSNQRIAITVLKE